MSSIPWLMIPFPRAMLGSELHRKCNFLQSSTRIVAEPAFGRLKESWKYLGCTIRGPNITTLPSVMHACCILHNMLVELSEEPDMEPTTAFDINDPLIDNAFTQEHVSGLEETSYGAHVHSTLMEYLDMQGVLN